MPQVLVALAGDRHHPDEAGELAQHPRCRLDHLLRPGRGADLHLEVAGEPAHLARSERLHREQVVHEDPVPLCGGDPAGRGVGRTDEPHLLEVGHDVADGRGTQVETGAARQRARPDRLAVPDVLLHQVLQQLLGAFTKHARPPASSHPRSDPGFVLRI